MPLRNLPYTYLKLTDPSDVAAASFCLLTNIFLTASRCKLEGPPSISGYEIHIYLPTYLSLSENVSRSFCINIIPAINPSSRHKNVSANSHTVVPTTFPASN